MAETIRSDNVVTRRSLFMKAAIGIAAAAGFTTLMQKRVLGKSVATPPIVLPKDSIFTPREDQRKKVLGE